MRNSGLDHFAVQPGDPVGDDGPSGDDHRQRPSLVQFGHGGVVGAADGAVGEGGVAQCHLRTDMLDMRVIYCVGNGSGGPAAVAGEEPSLSFVPYLVRVREDGVVRGLTLGHPALDEYLAFVGSRARLNTWLAVAWDLKIFFEVVGKEPAAVRTADVFAFLAAQCLHVTALTSRAWRTVRPACR